MSKINCVIILFLLFSNFLFCAATNSNQTAWNKKQTQLKELLEVTQAKNSLKISRDMLIADMPEGVRDIMSEILNPDELIKDVQKVYDRHLDEKTISAVLQFFKTPEGKKWVEAQPKILKDTMILSKSNAEKKLNKSIGK